MNLEKLSTLIEAYRNAPAEFHATQYWQSYEGRIVDEIRRLDPDQMRSGKYPILATFGFDENPYFCHPNACGVRKWVTQAIHHVHRALEDRAILPYGKSIADLRDVGYRHCQLLGRLCGARPIEEIQVSRFGNPADLFEVDGKPYTMHFLNYYVRYCFAHKHISLTPGQTIVELGSGAGFQVEVLMKACPGLTILCFDMPAQLFLCESYLTQALGPNTVVGTDQTLAWQDLSGVQPGRVHFLGNWQIPLLKKFSFDVFWNAASFGEMEPKVVENYLGYVLPTPNWVYLLQASQGKEVQGATHVERPIRFEDYDRLLCGYRLREKHDAYCAVGKLSRSGGYFEAVWSREDPPKA